MFVDVVCPESTKVPQGHPAAADGGRRNRRVDKRAGQKNLSSNRDSADAIIEEIINLLRQLKVKIYYGSSSSISNYSNEQDYDLQGKLVKHGQGSGPRS